jgi:hypothetical protein
MGKANWIKWLQVRIPILKEKHNEFWLSQALDGYKGDMDKKILADCWLEAQDAMLRNGGNPTMTQPFKKFIDKL